MRHDQKSFGSPWLLVVLGALTTLAPLSIDVYAPALPGMAADLHEPPALAQTTMTVFVLGLAVGQLLVGAFADRCGRKPLLVGGLALYVASSLLSGAAPSLLLLCAVRFAQAVAVSVAAVLSRAMVRDAFSGESSAAAFNTVMLINSVAPILAPVIGAGVLSVGPWRWIFFGLAFFGAVLLTLTAWSVPETHTLERRAPSAPGSMLRVYKGLLTDSVFMRYAIVGGAMFGSMFAYISQSSFLLQEGYGFSVVEYSVAFAGNGAAVIVVGILNARLLRRGGHPHVLLSAGVAVGLFGAVCALLAVSWHAPAGVLIGCIVVATAPLGLILGNATSLALERQGRAAAAAAALLGVVQFGAGAAAAAMATALGMGASMVVWSALAVAMLIVPLPKRGAWQPRG